jgi:RNA recognition motif-containing protein
VTSLYVGGVPPSVDKKELLPYFLAYGEVRASSAPLMASDGL